MGLLFPKRSTAMTKEISKKDQENLVKTSAEGSVELSESDLEKVAAGRKAGDKPLEYLKIKLEDVIISG
jgi:hypothetical protein